MCVYVYVLSQVVLFVQNIVYYSQKKLWYIVKPIHKLCFLVSILLLP